MEKKWKNKRFIDALKNAVSGIFYVIKTEKNLRIQLVVALLVILAGFFFKISGLEWIVLILIIFMVIFAELFNTTVEIVVDMYTTEYNENAKKAKDIAAGAVTIISISSIIIGIIIFLPKIINIVK